LRCGIIERDENVYCSMKMEYICSLNAFIARNEALVWGKLRTGRAGTDYTPPVPDEAQVRAELAEITESDATATSKALALFAWGTRSQLFRAGNKRTGLAAANKLLLASGAGMLTIREADMMEFNVHLLHWYDAGDAEPLTDYLYDHAIQGIEM